MTAPRKPRSDARLKTLPAERQEQIADFARAHSLAEVKAWLAEAGCTTSLGALSEFLSWLALKDQLSRNESTVESVLAQLKQTRPDLTEDEMFAAGQAFFSAIAIEQRDAKGWKSTQDLKFKRDLMELEREKFEFDAAKACLEKLPELKEIAADRSLNEDAKLQAVRERLFGVAPQ